MLVVSRRPGQSVLIGPAIEVFVLEVDGMQVRVGINADRSIRVLRRELVTQVETENRRALRETIPTPIENYSQLLVSQLNTPESRDHSGLVIPKQNGPEGLGQHPNRPESRG